ncbi:PTS sugar transporter subunit IIA [Clostridium sp. BJN0001]|uniref:PTS sugar transporter subunit IIA n=1 Tax=Clostridium sp. BJN0001 TaxID=2930219 RepID=UPI001FD1AC7F|nr:PTS sugar transporter subunit IIA [Clostridium sp. BJN0001]
MLKKLIEKNRFSFHDGFDKWEDAIQEACMPLIKDGAVEQAYVDSIINNVNKYGPYIVIAPDICIPHAQEGAVGVNETAVCFMRSKKPVHFGEDSDTDARLFFVLASTDNNIHLQNLSKLVELVENQDVVEKLIAAECKEDLEKIYKEYFLPV